MNSPALTVLVRTLCLCGTLALTACSSQTDVELLASARTFMAANDHKAAVVQLKSALQKNANLAEARFLLGAALLQGGDATTAVVELEKAQALKYDENLVVPELAQALLGSGQAKKVTDAYVGRRLPDAVAHSRLLGVVASAFAAQGQAARSEASVVAALQLDPKNVRARLLYAGLIGGKGRVDEALQLVAQVLAEDGKRHEAWQLRGELLWMGKSEPQAAAEAFRQALSIDPGYMHAHSALLRMAMQREDSAGFKAQLAKLVEARPNSVETLYYRAQAAVIDRDYKTAREQTQQLLRLAPNDASVLQIAAMVELNSGSTVVAESYLSKALQASPQSPAIRHLLAQTHLRSGQAQRALTVLQPVLTTDPEPSVLALAAEAHLQLGNLAESEALYARASNGAPNNTRLRTSMAMAQVAKGNADRGLSELLAISEKDTNTYADLGLISSHMRRGDTQRALAAIERLQGKLPTSALPHQLRGLVFLQSNDPAGARASFEKAVGAEPSYFPAIASLGGMDVAEKKPDRAVARFKALVVREPSNYRALMALSQLKISTGAPPEEIRALLDEAIKASPAEAAPYQLLVEFLLVRGEHRLAQTAAQDAVARLPGNLSLVESLARAQLANGEVLQAISNFGKLVAEQPASVPPLLRLAHAQTRNKDFTAANRTLRRALEVDATALQVHAALAEVAVAQQDFDGALRVARDLQKQMPKSAAGHLLESDLHAARKAWAPTIAALQGALARQKFTPTAMRLHGLLTVAGREAEAKQLAGDWLNENPSDTQFISHLGAMALENRRYAEAESQYRRVVSLQPDDAAALNNLGWLMAQQGKPGGSVYAEKALTLQPDQPAMMDTLSMALAAEGKLAPAIEWQKKAVAKAGSVGSYRLRLAKLLIEAGDKGGARSELDTLAGLGEKFPAHAEVQRLLKTL